MPDFESLLSTPVSDIKKPKPLPEGTYSGVIKSHKFDEAKTKEGPKPILDVTIQFQSAMEDVDEDALTEALQGGNLADKTRHHTFWLTPDAQYRLVDFIKSLDLDTEGKTLGEIIPLMINQSVYASVVNIPSRNDPNEKFDSIDRLASPAAL